MKKIYLTCALTHAPEEFRKSIEAFKNELRANYEVLEFLGLIKGTPQDVYRHDTGNVKKCDLLLADVSYPAIGLGFEICLALHLSKRVLAVAKHEAKVTRLVLGIEHKNFKFMRYKMPSEVILEVKRLLA